MITKPRITVRYIPYLNNVCFQVTFPDGHMVVLAYDWKALEHFCKLYMSFCPNQWQIQHRYTVIPAQEYDALFKGKPE